MTTTHQLAYYWVEGHTIEYLPQHVISLELDGTTLWRRSSAPGRRGLAANFSTNRARAATHRPPGREVQSLFAPRFGYVRPRATP